jgi:hypothetical protein
MFGDIIKTACDGTGDAPSIDPDSGNGYCLEVSSIQSNCNANNPLVIFEYDNYKVWCAADTEYTFTFKAQTTYAGISSGNLILKAWYLDGTSGGSRSIETENATAIAQRSNDTDWTQTIAVTFTTGEAGFVFFQMELTEYEANNELYVWPVAAVS